MGAEEPARGGSLSRDPWRAFFPLGVLLAWAGVLHWLLYALGVTDRYRAVFHATAQIQGFMTSVALGFLLTFVPRRTGTASPPPVVPWAGALAAVGATVAAWEDRVALAQGAWLAGMAVVGAFLARRILAARGSGRLPAVFSWVLVALVAGGGGAALVAIAAALGPHEVPELWRLGRGLLLQGFVTALVVGVGGTMLPVLVHGAPGPAGAPGAPAGPAVHLAAALAFLGSFPVEAWVDARLGLALRAVVAGGVLVGTARLWRPPTVPGLHRWLIWIAAWLLAGGPALAALLPEQRSTALHLAFLGSFALMALAVSLHVALSHGGRPELLTRRPWQVWALGVLLLAAAAFRLLAGLDAAHLRAWLGLAAASFLLATGAWAALVLPAIGAAARAGARAVSGDQRAG